jgi:peptide/nickel transport system substrate-binding protein
VEWSDGQPFTSADIVFTIKMLIDNAPKLAWSTDMKQWVKDVSAPNESSVQFTLTKPNPRFVASYFTFHQDVGVFIVPEHIFKGQDAQSFTNFDLAKGWPVVTGPYKMIYSDPQQKIWDRRDDWWGAKTGFHPLPAPQRLIFLPGYDESKQVELLINNEVDCTLSMQLGNIKAAMDRNPKVTSWSGTNPPYGYVDWWPTGLGFNDMKEPFNDPDIRHAINNVLNRDEIVKIGYQGAGESTVVPYPGFPSLNAYTKSIEDLLQKYPVDDFNLDKSATMMQSKGYTKDSDGFWSKDGNRLSIVVITFPVEQDVTPVIVQQLRKGGFDASFKMPSNFVDLIYNGDADAYVFGHGGSVQDPYFTMRLYQTQFTAATGTPASQPYRWSNPDYDKIVDQMGTVAPDDPQLTTLFHQAMEIWLKELPDIPLVQFYHRNPVNTTYWTNWPDQNNPYINSANWHRTFELVLMGIQPAAA